MRIELRGLRAGEGAPPLDLAIAPGAPVVVPVETDERPKLVSLVVGGRLRPASGSVTVDGRADASALRRRVAVVDTPFTSEPTPTVALRTVVAEELAFAGRRTGPTAVRRLLADHGLADAAGEPFGLLPTADRIRLLSELALLRPGIEALVVTSPERHGGDPREWFPALAAVGERGVAVVVVTDQATAGILGALGAVATAPDPAPEPDADPAPQVDRGTDAGLDLEPSDEQELA